MSTVSVVRYVLDIVLDSSCTGGVYCSFSVTLNAAVKWCYFLFFFYLIDFLEWNASACLVVMRAYMTKEFLLCSLYLLKTPIVISKYSKFAPIPKKLLKHLFLKIFVENQLKEG